MLFKTIQWLIADIYIVFYIVLCILVADVPYMLLAKANNESMQYIKFTAGFKYAIYAVLAEGILLF